jgi:hypothetical protein
MAQGTIPLMSLKQRWGHPILFLSREKVRNNKIFKNNELKTGPLFGNTSPSESVHGFLFNFDESLANQNLGTFLRNCVSSFHPTSLYIYQTISPLSPNSAQCSQDEYLKPGQLLEREDPGSDLFIDICRVRLAMVTGF